MSVSAGYVVSVAISDGDKPPTVLVGKRDHGEMKVINAIQTKEGLELVLTLLGPTEANALMTKKEG